nr:low molecular weight protein-tyrosine-phosphatase [Corynebacterium lactis]
MPFSSSLRTETVYVVFVCSGNICRSPMAEIIVRDAVENAGLDSDVLLGSCGIGGWHVGEPADQRAQDELEHAGYDPTHTAAQLGSEHSDANLFIAMDDSHVRGLRRAGIPKERIRLLRSFDPSAPRGAEVEDPYYGGRQGFVRTRLEIEAAADGIVEWIKETLALSSDR